MNSTEPHHPTLTPCAMLAALEAKLDGLARLLTRQDQAPGETTDRDHDTGHQADHQNTEDLPHE